MWTMSCSVFASVIYVILIRYNKCYQLLFLQVFQSTLPVTVFNLPPTTTNNEAEGFVLKPKSQIFYKPDGTRIMLKHKNPRFTENCNTKTIQVPTPSKTSQNQTSGSDLSDHEMIIFEEMKQFINENRINAVLSKLNESMKSKRKGVIYLIANDAMDDIMIEMMPATTLSKKEMGKYKKNLNIYTEEYCTFHNIDFML